MSSLSAIPKPVAAAQPGLRPDRIWLLADDLTGACDAGGAMLRAGLNVRVWTGARACFQAPETVQAVNTASRNLLADEAASAVAKAAAELGSDKRAVFFKKIDSTLRGPIAAELNAARQALGARAILFAPAFPAAGRTVENGVLQVEDIGGRRQAISIRDALAGLLAGLDDSCAFVANAEELPAALARGKTILVCDSKTQADLDALALAAQPLAGLLYAGSAGLAQAVGALYGAAAPGPVPPQAARTLVVCGTPHPVTKLQLESFDRARFATAEVVRIPCESSDESCIRALFESIRPQALVLTGGDTALLALTALGVHSLLLRGECAAGIPWGMAAGGIADGCTVVTKSGGFGSVSVLNDILEMLTGAV